MRQKIQDKLYAWGLGRAINTAPNGFPRENPIAKMMRNPGRATVKLAPLSDQEQEIIDRHISEMKLKKPVEYQVIVLAYIYRCRDKEIGKRTKTTTYDAKITRIRAEAWLEAKIE